ncbi:DUF983 domain-containing protein [Vicingaceae bacterium]|jgi:uncharacterized protein (DUF983 family)|nr:DUF983 domain-containing protein [Vicingaceae bacterium]
MAQNSNVFKSITQCKCPKCHKGDLFINKSVFKFKDFLEIPNNCEKCNQDFQIEAGFYLGAMFVSYGLTVAITVAVFVAFVTFNAYSLVPFLIATTIALIVTTPYILRVSRSIWIAMSVRYDANAILKYETQNKS